MASPVPTASTSAIQQDATTKAAIFQRLHPRVYLDRFIQEGIRPDGREFTEWRDVSVNVGSITTANGSSLVRVGKTTVVCGVKAELAEPELDKPNQGYLVSNLDLPALCSPKYKPGPPTEDAQVLSEKLNEILRVSNIVPVESLCIQPAKSVWVLYVDAICINFDGNALDAALLAMVAALRNTTLPKARWDEDQERTICRAKNQTKVLENQSTVSMCFGVFDQQHILVDPTAFEEPLLDTNVCIVMDNTGKVISITQAGAGLEDGDAVEQCLKLAQERYSFLLDSFPSQS